MRCNTQFIHRQTYKYSFEHKTFHCVIQPNVDEYLAAETTVLRENMLTVTSQ